MNNFNNSAGNPVLELQKYLIEIARCKPQIPIINLTGIMDEDTIEALAIFQSIHGIQATGKVNLITWEALVNEYHRCHVKYSCPNQVSIFPCDDFTVGLGDENDVVYVIQILLGNLGKQYKSSPIEITGIYDEKTEEAIKQFQKANKLDISGIVDRDTWNALTHINNTCGLFAL